MRTEVIYAAGVVDSDGAVGITRSIKAGRNGNPRYSMFVDVTNTYKPLINWFLDEFGGHIYISHHSDGRQRESWRWCMRSFKAAEFLKLILPYLMVKKERAETALEFVKWVSHNRNKKPKEYYDNQEVFYQIMKILNRRGVQDN